MKVISSLTLLGLITSLFIFSCSKKDEVIKSTGNSTIPEGTNVTWKVSTRSTDEVMRYAKDTLNFTNRTEGKFEATKRIYNNTDYSKGCCLRNRFT